ncbi:hypothetical protein CYJ99_08645 [Neisseria perflava]|nr:hypothetical protein CYJ99_08645 [Neisseria perflava]
MLSDGLSHIGCQYITYASILTISRYFLSAIFSGKLAICMIKKDIFILILTLRKLHGHTRPVPS